MNWILEALASAVFLGLYDICKKRSLVGNAVFPVLFLSVCCGAALWLPWVIWSSVGGADSLPLDLLQVDALGWRDHLFLFAKALIVGSSWIFSYFALKHLPVSVASGIRATGPLWTLGGAILLFAERPNGQQWAGIAVTLVSFIALSLAGQREGLIFHRNRWVLYMMLGTLAGAASGLYDKHLLGVLGYSASTVQAWFTLYMVVVIAPFAWGWLRRWWPRGAFEWRWSIPLIGVALLIADYSYFTALGDPEALVSIVSCLRRGSVLITFIAGYFLFQERNYRRKTPAVLGILAGILLIVLS